jgi:hypothetical protein
MVNTRNRVAANNAENNERATTKKATCRHPLRLLLSKCWLCKHRCFRPCSRPWSTCMHNPKYHRRRGIDWEIFSALSHQPFLMLWSRWMLMNGSSLLRRSCKWYNAIIVQLTGGMLMWKPMRNLRAPTGWSLEPLSVHIMFPRELSS